MHTQVLAYMTFSVSEGVKFCINQLQIASN